MNTPNYTEEIDPFEGLNDKRFKENVGLHKNCQIVEN